MLDLFDSKERAKEDEQHESETCTPMYDSGNIPNQWMWCLEDIACVNACGIPYLDSYGIPHKYSKPL